MNHGIRSYKKKGFRKTPGLFRVFTRFLIGKRFSTHKTWRIEMRGSHLSTAYFGFSHCLTPRPNDIREKTSGPPVYFFEKTKKKKTF